MPAWLDRGHAMIYRKVAEVARTGAIPIVLGGDHSITWPSATAIAEVRAPQRIGIVHFDAHADTASEDWGVLAGHGTPMRRLIESGAVLGRNFVQIGLRGYWPSRAVFEWMREQGMRWHLMSEIEERGAEVVIAEAIDQALDGPDLIYLSLDIDVIDPGLAPGTGTPEPGGMLTREVLRAIRQVVGRVDLAAMDVVEVSPPYDHAETTAMAANRAVLEAISALAAKQAAGGRVRWDGDRRGRGVTVDTRSGNRGATRSPACTTSISRRTRATSTCTSRWPTGWAARSSSWPSAAAGSPCRSPRPATRSPASISTRRCCGAPTARATAAGRSVARRIHLIEADARDLRLPEAGTFRLAFIALNSLLVLGDRRDQARAFETHGPAPGAGRRRDRRRLAARRRPAGALRRTARARVRPARPRLGPRRHQDGRRPGTTRAAAST